MDKESVLNNFRELTSTPASVAQVFLERNKWDIELALEEFYNGTTQRAGSASPSSSSPESYGATTNPEQASNPPRPVKKTAQSKFKSFSQLVSETANDEDDEKNYYAGGGRGSALNVENPDEPKNIVQDLLRKAERNQGHPDRMKEEEEKKKEEASAARSHFGGVGHSLGDGVTPSRRVGHQAPVRLEKAERKITFWKDGFQVGDGRLYRYDDPSNKRYLDELNQGHAPIELLDVKLGQDVDVSVEKRLDEEFKPPKRKLAGFYGSGQRLGSPVSTDYTAPVQQTAQSPVETKAPEPVVEEPKGDAQVQIRLADGRRVVRRIMSTAPVQELYDYVGTETASDRAWSLNHAFPVKPVDDKTQSVKEAGLVNSVVVQRWI